MKKLIAVTLASLMVFTVGCDQGKQTEQETKGTKTEATTESAEEEAGDSEKKIDYKVKELPQLESVKKGETVAIIKTNMGDIKLRFFPEYAPKAVENFLTHAKDEYYDKVIFHRVINNFMIQSGDPLGTGTGGTSIWGKEFENEVSGSLRNFRGALCMANAGPDTNASQFFIVQNPSLDDQTKAQMAELLNVQEEVVNPEDTENPILVKEVFPEGVVNEYVNNGGYPSLDFQYTVFGQVYEGMDIVDKIAAVKTNDSDKPLEDVVIKHVEVTKYK